MSISPNWNNIRASLPLWCTASDGIRWVTLCSTDCRSHHEPVLAIPLFWLPCLPVPILPSVLSGSFFAVCPASYPIPNWGRINRPDLLLWLGRMRALNVFLGVNTTHDMCLVQTTLLHPVSSNESQVDDSATRQINGLPGNHFQNRGPKRGTFLDNGGPYMC